MNKTSQNLNHYPELALEESVLGPLFHHRLVRHVAHMLQDQKAAHQADVLGRAAHVLAVKRGERIFESFPVYLVGKAVQQMTLVKHVGQGIKQRWVFDLLFYHKNLPVFDANSQKPADISKIIIL